MVKIKCKVQKTLPQLIEYIFANNLKHKWKDSDNTGGYIHVYDDGKISVDKCTVDSIFTVEVEEEITEDTVIDNLYKMDEFYEFYSTEYKTIKDVIRHSVFKVKAVYLNDDLTMTLIWRDGKLVK